MDKITGDWINTFGHIEHNTVYAGPRYTEIVSTADEPGLASAKARWIQVPGMNASLVSITPEKKVKLCTARETACIQSAFILNGLANSQFNGRPITTRGSSHAFQYSPYVDEHHIIEGDRLEALHLEFDPAYFTSLLLSADEAIFENIANSLERKEQFMVPPTQLPLHVSMSDIIRAIQHCTFHSFTRLLFIEAKLLELVAMQMDYLSTLYAPTKNCISVTDREKLFSLKEYIEKHYLQPLSLKQLGRLSGLNEFKLKKGYRYLFNTTVFGHIHHLRMQQARQWLAEGDMTVTEISARIGYSSSGNFSAAFKKQFGYPPTQAVQMR